MSIRSAKPKMTARIDRVAHFGSWLRPGGAFSTRWSRSKPEFAIVTFRSSSADARDPRTLAWILRAGFARVVDALVRQCQSSTIPKRREHHPYHQMEANASIKASTSALLL